MTGAEKPRSTGAAVLIPFAIVTLIWSSTWYVIRDQVGSVPPSWSVFYRFATAGIAMAVFAVAKGESLRLDARGLRFAAAVGISQFCLNFNFVYRAEQHITSGVVAVIFALLLVPNALLSRLFLGQRMGRQLMIGSLVAMAGIALLFVHEAQIDPHGPGQAILGIGFTLVAVLCASTANVLQATETAKAYPMVATLAVAMLIGAGADALVAFVASGPPVIEARWSYVAGILYLGLLGSALTFPLYFGVIRTIGPAKAAYSSVIIPVIAMAISTLLEGYRWTLLAALGAALAMAGLVVALRARRPNR